MPASSFHDVSLVGGAPTKLCQGQGACKDRGEQSDFVEIPFDTLNVLACWEVVQQSL